MLSYRFKMVDDDFFSAFKPVLCWSRLHPTQLLNNFKFYKEIILCVIGYHAISIEDIIYAK